MSEEEINPVKDSAHVDAVWEYSVEYQSRLVTFLTTLWKEKLNFHP
ncbi:MAG: hypothetical protein OR994_08200 [Candidatus Poseidoniales archaeon]|nr:hypothetical protein [Candidatus Poseidoniales archaeon]